MPKQNVSANTKKRRVTFAKKLEVRDLMEEVATRALAASSISKVKKKMKGILKKSSYKKKKESRKDDSIKKKSVRYLSDQQVQKGCM